MKYRQPLHLLALTIFLFVMIARVQSQWLLDFGTFAGYSENIIGTYNAPDDFLAVPNIEISRMTESLEFYYSGTFTQFQQNTKFNNTLHGIGFDYRLIQAANILSTIGTNYSIANYRDNYSYYNNQQLYGFINLKYYPTRSMLIKGGFALHNKNFVEEKAWNHWESLLYLQYNLFLKTKTTIRLGADFLYRNFRPYATDEDVTSRYSGKGGRGTYYSISRYDELPSLWQTFFVARLAQSLGRRTGGYAEYAYRYNHSEGNPYELEIESFSPIDDYFGYRGNYLTANLKYKITNAFWSAFNYHRYFRHYVNRPVYEYDFDGQTWVVENDDYVMTALHREDTGQRVEISFGYAINRFLKKASTLEIMALFTYRKNDSNDPYFRYEDKSAGLQLNYGLQW